jgi:hypothetical protein
MTKKTIFILLTILFLIVIAIFKFSNRKPISDSSPKPIDNNPVVCTMDAKLCPDGSSVGRIGPDCEFVPCPE